MKKLSIFIAILSIIFFVSCKKKDNKQLSTWYVNNDSFSTNDVTVDIQKKETGMNATYSNNCFSFSFNLGYLPTTGKYKIDCSLQDPTFVCFGVVYNSIYYAAPTSPGYYISAGLVNGKSKYTLIPTWFKSTSNLNDSVLIQGVFNEP